MFMYTVHWSKEWYKLGSGKQDVDNVTTVILSIINRSVEAGDTSYMIIFCF